MAIIKKFWFVRNVYKLIGQLGIAVSVFSLFYSGLCIFALAGGDYSDFFMRFGKLIPIPVVGLILSIDLYSIRNRISLQANRQMKFGSEWRKKPKRNIALIIRLITCWELGFPAILLFWQLDLLNTAKQIQGFGLFPAYLFVFVGIIYSIADYAKNREIRVPAKSAQIDTDSDKAASNGEEKNNNDNTNY